MPPQARELLSPSREQVGDLSEIIDRFPATSVAIRVPTTAPDAPAKPFVQWVGGKREMIPHYANFLPTDYGTYFEPFAGGAAMYFHLLPTDAVLADLNAELVLAYIGLRDECDEVISLLGALKAKHSKDLYLRVRSLDREFDLEEDFTAAEIAARLIYLNQTCFNAIYRVNRKGQFNVPIGSSLNRTILDADALKRASVALSKSVIIHSDFANAVAGAASGDFVYLDPPYHPVSEHSNFTRYTKEQFPEEDQLRIKLLVDDLTNRGVKVMLSNSDCPFVRGLYEAYSAHEVQSGRNLNSRAERRGKVSELVITNFGR